MSLTPEELESQIASQNQMIADLKKSGEEVTAKLAEKDATISGLTKKLETSPTAELETLKKKVAELEPAAKENAQLKQQIFLGDISKKYPLVDLSLVSGKDNAELEANAAKLQAHIEKVRPVSPATPAANAAGNSNPNQPWSALGPAGGDTEEARRKQEAEEGKTKISEAVASGSPVRALDAVVAASGGFAKAFRVPAPAK